MYSELQEAIQSYLQDEEFGAGSVYLEDQPNTPNEFQRRLNEVGWGIVIGKPRVQKDGPIVKVLSPVLVDENRTVNRASGGPNMLPDEVILTVENLLRNYRPSDLWTPIKLNGDVSQLFPEGGKVPWLAIIETKTIPVALYGLGLDSTDVLVFDDDSEIDLIPGQ